MGKGGQTGRDWGSLSHLNRLWGHYPRLLYFKLTLFLLEGVVDTFHMLRTLFSLEGFCAGWAQVLDHLVARCGEKRIRTELLVVEEVFGLLSMTFDAVIGHTTLDTALTWSSCGATKPGML